MVRVARKSTWGCETKHQGDALCVTHLESAYASLKYTELIASVLVAAASLWVAIECRMKLTHLKRGGGAAETTNSPVDAPVILEEAKAAPASAVSAAPAAEPGIERRFEDGASILSPWPQCRCGIVPDSPSSFLCGRPSNPSAWAGTAGMMGT